MNRFRCCLSVVVCAAIAIGVATSYQSLRAEVALKPFANADHYLSYISATNAANLGATVSVVFSNKNLGTQNSLATTCKFYLSTNPVAAAIWHVNDVTVGRINVGVTIMKTNVAFTIPMTQPTGTNYIIGVSGFGDNDLNLSNNTNSTVIVINN